MKVSNIVHYTKEELTKAKDHIVRLAHIEGFEIRMPNQPKQVSMKKTDAPDTLHFIVPRRTDIRVEWVLDGSGRGQIDTSIRFFDHMLELLAKHGFLRSHDSGQR